MSARRAGGQRFVIVGHRGIAAEFPENTAPAFRAAVDRGVERVEFDVRLTADARVVVHHDETTRRLCGKPKPGSGGAVVRHLTLDELRRRTVRARFRPRPPERDVARLLSLDEALAILRPETVVEVELKGVPADAEALADEVLAALSRTGGLARARITSSEPDLLRAIRARASDAELGIVVRASPAFDFEPVAREIGAEGIVPNARHVRPAFVRRCHDAGWSVIPYTVNTKAAWRRIRNAGADGVITDDPARIERYEREVRGARRGSGRERAVTDGVLQDARGLVIDLGSTSVKVGATAADGRVLAIRSAPCPTVIESDRIGVDALDLDRVTRGLAESLLDRGPRIETLAIASQRSTFVLWDAETGDPLGDAPSWRCHRGRNLVARMQDSAELVQRRTGLRSDAAYAASKIAWKLRRSHGGPFHCAPLSSYLLWRWSGGRLHRTDPTLAQRMLLMNLARGSWDRELLDRFGIAGVQLPEIGATFGELGEVTLGRRRLALRCEVGDQQAAFEALTAGAASIRARAGSSSSARRVALNLGTGAFLLAETGERLVRSRTQLSSVAYRGPRGSRYLLEGAARALAPTLDAFTNEHARDRLALAECVARAGDATHVLPAREGLGSPYWDERRRFVVRGKRDTASVARAMFEGFGHLLRANARAMRRGIAAAPQWAVGGGLSGDPHLVQAIADTVALPLVVANRVKSEGRLAEPGFEATLYGAARLALAAEASSGWPDDVAPPAVEVARFEPRASARDAAARHADWLEALAQALS